MMHGQCSGAARRRRTREVVVGMKGRMLIKLAELGQVGLQRAESCNRTKEPRLSSLTRSS